MMYLLFNIFLFQQFLIKSEELRIKNLKLNLSSNNIYYELLPKFYSTNPPNFILNINPNFLQTWRILRIVQINYHHNSYCKMYN